jgi:hypothetical protein
MKNIDTLRRLSYEGRPKLSTSNAKEIHFLIRLFMSACLNRTPSLRRHAPQGRNDHTAVWTGTEVIVWGGYGNAFLNSGGRYDPLTDTWTATRDIGAPEPRYSHTAVWTGTEMIVWGGYNYQGDIF